MSTRTALVALALRAATPAAAKVPPDPLEGVNRHINAFNGLLRNRLLGPVA